MALAKIRITGEGPTAEKHGIYMDGVDISHYVRGFRLTSRIGFLDTIELVLIGNVELPDELKANVVAIDATALGDKIKHYVPLKVGD